MEDEQWIEAGRIKDRIKLHNERITEIKDVFGRSVSCPSEIRVCCMEKSCSISKNSLNKALEIAEREERKIIEDLEAQFSKL